MEYSNFIDLVHDAINIDLANGYDEKRVRDINCQNTLKESYIWLELRGNRVLCKTEVYHSWCKDIAKEVRILNKSHIPYDVLPVVYRLIEEISEQKYIELYGK